MMKLLYIPLLLLLASPVLMAQKDTAACNLQISIRHNGHIDFYKHPKIGLPGGPLVFPGSDWYNGRKDRESYYYEGIGIAKQHGYFTYRLWIDYYHYKQQGEWISIDTNIISNSSYEWLISGIRLSPGLGKEWRWKFLGVSVGAEIPIYFQTKRKDVSEFPNFNITGETIIDTYTAKNGFNSVALAAFAGIDFHFLKRMSATIEFSNGVLFQRKSVTTEAKYEYYDVNGKLYKTRISSWGEPGWVKKERWFYLIPSLSLSYRL